MPSCTGVKKTFNNIQGFLAHFVQCIYPGGVELIGFYIPQNT